MRAVVRVRPWVLGVGAWALVLASLLIAADPGEAGFPVAGITLVVVGAVWSTWRDRVEVDAAQVHIRRALGSRTVPRTQIRSVHVGGTPGRPAHVLVDDGQTVALPALIGPRRVATALGLPLLTWRGDREAPMAEPIRSWVLTALLGLGLLATVVAVGFTMWG